MPSSRARVAPRAVLAFLSIHVIAAAGASAPPGGGSGLRRAVVDEGIVATLEDANEIHLEVQARPRDSYVSLATKYAGSERMWADIELANGGRPVTPGLFYAIPFQVLTREMRARAVMALFPGDGPGEEGWVHRVPQADEGQSLESVALWFTGETSLADDLAVSNGVELKPPQPGSEIIIPGSLLLAEFEKDETLAPVPPIPPPPPLAPPVPAPERPRKGPVKAGELTFFDDETGGYAVYRLKPGEALYSSVVVRFTGRLDPEEVAAVAKRVADLSGIARLTSIRVGQAIKIPRDLIKPEHLPPGDPARQAYEAGLEAAAKHRITASARGLQGVTLILDAGHGGDDIGAHRNGVHEDDHVYDIMCRLKTLAEQTTAARVLTTIKDRSSGYQPVDVPLEIDRDEIIMTTPPYAPRQPHVGTAGVNLRWYLINAHFRSLVAAGADPERVVFLSIHADSLHPSVRGAMVYVPGQGYRAGTYGHVGKLYDRKEVRALRYVKFTRGERERSEGLSRKLAGRMIQAFSEAGLPIHPYEPVRDHVIRRRRAWSPAVIRTSLVPQSLLLEVVNLNNSRDSELIQQPEFRQKVATAILAALRRHYAGGASGGDVRKARAAR